MLRFQPASQGRDVGRPLHLVSISERYRELWAGCAGRPVGGRCSACLSACRSARRSRWSARGALWRGRLSARCAGRRAERSPGLFGSDGAAERDAAMGVPKFYRWISERYPCLSQVLKEHQVSRERGLAACTGPAAVPSRRGGGPEGRGPGPAVRDRGGAGRAAPSAAWRRGAGGRHFGTR